VCLARINKLFTFPIRRQAWLWNPSNEIKYCRTPAKRTKEAIHVEKCKRDVAEGKGRRMGSRYDYFSFCFPISELGTGEIKKAWWKEQRNYFANEWTNMNKKVINAMKMIVCSLYRSLYNWAHKVRKDESLQNVSVL